MVKDLWSRFIAKGVKQDGIVVGAFVNAFVAYGDIDTALTALDFGYEKKMYISPSVYFSAMRLFATNGDEQGIRKLSSKLQRKNKSGEIKAECDMFEAEACTAAGNVEGARAAIFRVQNGNEEAAARVFRDRSSGVLVALFVQEVLEIEEPVPVLTLRAMIDERYRVPRESKSRWNAFVEDYKAKAGKNVEGLSDPESWSQYVRPYGVRV